MTRSLGAELEFLPTTEISLFRLSDRTRAIFAPLYQLQFIPQTRQPKSVQLLNIIYLTLGLNDHLSEYGYSAKLNTPDIEKIIKRLRKTAEKYDQLLCHVDGMTISESVDSIERAIARMPKSNNKAVAIGFDNSVRGTTPDNESAITDYPFAVYSGLEAVFPVCDDADELSNLYRLVVHFLTDYGCIFPTSAGVHLHVCVDTEKTGKGLVNQLSNTFIIGAALSSVLESILPEHRRNNDFCKPMGADVTEHMLKQKYKTPKSKLEYVSKKVKMVAAGVSSDNDVLCDRTAIMYEMSVGTVYGVAPLQHEHNYKKIMEATSLANAANIVRNPRYFALSPAPMMKDEPIPTVEWRVLPSSSNVELISNYFQFLSRAIALSDIYKSVKIECIDGVDYIILDGEYFENTIEVWLELTDCADLTFSHFELYSSNLEYSGEYTQSNTDSDDCGAIALLNQLFD